MSLPMPSGSCWTKRTTESNRTAPEILRGFFCALSASGRIMPHKRSHAAQSADHRSSRHAGTDPHGPATQPAILAAHQLPHSRTALLSKPCFPTSEARHTPRFPITQAQTHTVQLPSPLSSPFTSSPIPAHLSSPSDLYKNPGSRPPPGFFVISGSVRSPSQRRLR